MRKQGQVTIFLIIGIILLAGVVTLNVFKSDSDISKIEIKVPQEMLPIKNYIAQCINQVGEEGIRKIGKSGGYIGTSTTDVKYTKTSFKINEVIEPTESEGILFYNGLDWKIPYWQYFKSPNNCMANCVCDSKQPDLLNSDSSIQKQLERYLDENLKSCIKLDEINGFESIKGDVFKSKVLIGKEDVQVILNYHVEAKTSSGVISADNFDATIPVRLKQVYELANSLTNDERNYTYLERQAMTVISSFTGLSTSKLPPIADSEMTPGGRGTMWIKSDVKKNVGELLSIYTPVLSVADTSNFEPRYDRYALFILPNKFPQKDMSVSFSYLPSWPIYFNLKGRGVAGELIRPESMGSSLFEFIGVKKYNYYYDFSYPVMVRIHDKESFDGEGFDFYFALESNVRFNKELKCDGPPKPTPVMDLAGPLVCKKSQACANITLNVKDAYTGEKINDSILSYLCADTTCALEPADILNQSSNKYGIPQCLNARISASKEGYSSNSILNSYFCGEKYSQDLELYPFIELNASLMKKKLTKVPMLSTGTKVSFALTPKADSLQTLLGGVIKSEETEKDNSYWILEDINVSLIPSETALLVLEKIKESESEEDFTVTTAFNGPVTKIIKLIPGRYNAQIMVSYKLPDSFGIEKYVIPELKVHKEGDLLTDDIDYTLPEVIFNETILAGQLILNNNTGVLNITREDLQGKKYVKFFVPGMTKFNELTHDDLEIFGRFEELSLGERDKFNPIFTSSRNE